VVLAPPVTEEDDDDPRPLLKIGKSGVEETFPDELGPKTKTKKPALDPKAATDYDAALSLAKSKKWKEALDAFAGFVVRYPDHPYASNALFWRGECYFALGQMSAAVEQYEGLLASYPASSKVPDALLKLGMAETKLGATAKAKAAYARLRKEFPGSDATKKIPKENAS
jgi:tol-pal system protein YbgF